jgi:hypothetical protein
VTDYETGYSFKEAMENALVDCASNYDQPAQVKITEDAGKFLDASLIRTHPNDHPHITNLRCPHGKVDIVRSATSEDEMYIPSVKNRVYPIKWSVPDGSK